MFNTDEEFYAATKEQQDAYLRGQAEMFMKGVKLAYALAGVEAKVEIREDSMGTPILYSFGPDNMWPIWMRGPLPSGHAQVYMGFEFSDTLDQFAGYCLGQPGEFAVETVRKAQADAERKTAIDPLRGQAKN
jgi:hypothetical protein